MKLIDKDAILAEIESLLDKGKYHEEYDCAYRDGNNGALYALKGKVNSLEVKEVDLDKPFEGIKVQTSMESGSLDEVIVTTKYKAQKGEEV